MDTKYLGEMTHHDLEDRGDILNRFAEKALFLDLDGTVRITKGSKPCPNHPDEQEVLPGRVDLIKHYAKEGYLIIGVTNQGGIGLGLMTEQENRDCIRDLHQKMGNCFDHVYYAMAAPSRNDFMTKPNPGMLFKAQADYNLVMENCIMVGDRDSDEAAARKAGVEFRWANKFFGD